MGVDLRCRKTGNSITLGFGGFARWRCKIAELHGQTWYKHYKKLLEAPLAHTQAWYEEFDQETAKLIKSEKLDAKIIDFCLQPDVQGSINYGACKNILRAIGDYTDNYAYTYAAYADHDWDKLKSILQDCVNTKSKLMWD